MNAVTSNAVADLFLFEEDTSYDIMLEPKHYTEWLTNISETKLGYRVVSFIAMPFNNDAILTTVHTFSNKFKVTVFNSADIQQTQAIKLTVIWMKVIA